MVFANKVFSATLQNRTIEKNKNLYKDLGAGDTRGRAASLGIVTAALSSALSQRDKGGSDCHNPDLGAPGSQLPREDQQR